MRTRTKREWTFEDVRQALDTVYGNVAGINIAGATGYLVEECERGNQPTSAKEEKPPTEPLPPAA